MAKSFIFAIIAASMIASTANCKEVFRERLLQSTMVDPPQAQSPLYELLPNRPLPGCSLGPVCPPGNTIMCENDEENGETGGCICTLVHLCHPGRRNCTFFEDILTSGMPCGF